MLQSIATNKKIKIIGQIRQNQLFILIRDNNKEPYDILYVRANQKLYENAGLLWSPEEKKPRQNGVQNTRSTKHIKKIIHTG